MLHLCDVLFTDTSLKDLLGYICRLYRDVFAMAILPEKWHFYLSEI